MHTLHRWRADDDVLSLVLAETTKAHDLICELVRRRGVWVKVAPELL
jgi:peptidoglycan/xylan/chitin deacetylase (PgdA/CDA1 family)